MNIIIVILIIIIINMYQFCCRRRRSWPFKPVMSSLFWDKFLVTSYSDCLCILCVVFLCFWYHVSFDSIFAFPSALFISPPNCSCLFLKVWSRNLLYPAISITSSFDFFSVHDILISFPMHYISSDSSLPPRSFVTVQHSHPMPKDGPYVGFQSVDYGVDSDISVNEDGLYLGECVFRQSYHFLYLCVASSIWSYWEACAILDAYLFNSFVTYRNV